MSIPTKIRKASDVRGKGEEGGRKTLLKASGRVGGGPGLRPRVRKGGPDAAREKEKKGGGGIVLLIGSKSRETLGRPNCFHESHARQLRKKEGEERSHVYLREGQITLWAPAQGFDRGGVECSSMSPEGKKRGRRDWSFLRIKEGGAGPFRILQLGWSKEGEGRGGK